MADRAVSRDPEATIGALRGWLGDAVGDRDVELIDVVLPTEGASSETIVATARWQSTAGSRQERLVFRVQPEHPVLYLEPDVIREGHVMRGARAAGIAVPGVQWIVQDRSAIGLPFIVMEFIDGRLPAAVPSHHQTGWVSELSPGDRARMYESGLAELARVHAMPWRVDLGSLHDEAVTGSGLDRYLDRLERSHRWAASGRDLGVIDAALAYLVDSRPEAEELCLNWGDARPGNIIFDADLSVAAIIDWEAACIGPREIDLGWWLMWEDFLTTGSGVPLLEGAPTPGETIASYERLSGRTVTDIDYYIVLAGCMFAVLMTRYFDGLVERGMVPSGTTMHVANPITQMLARRLDLPVPPLAPEFAAAAGA